MNEISFKKDNISVSIPHLHYLTKFIKILSYVRMLRTINLIKNVASNDTDNTISVRNIKKQSMGLLLQREDFHVELWEILDIIRLES